jgi:hypothetical protein
MSQIQKAVFPSPAGAVERFQDEGNKALRLFAS